MQSLGQQFDGSLNITNAADFSPRLLVSSIYLVRELLIKRSFALAVLSQLAYTHHRAHDWITPICKHPFPRDKQLKIITEEKHLSSQIRSLFYSQCSNHCYVLDMNTKFSRSLTQDQCYESSLLMIVSSFSHSYFPKTQTSFRTLHCPQRWKQSWQTQLFTLISPP